MLKCISLGAAALVTLTDLAESQQLPAIRPLGPVVAASSDSFGGNVSVRHLKHGVLVNDVQHRRLLLLDSMLANPIVVADTTPATANAYSGRTAGLIAYRGDSSLFVDPQSLSMLVIDPDGKVGRVMSVPRSQDAMMLGSVVGGASFDGARLVYRGMPRPQFRGAGPGGVPMPPESPESIAVVRVDLATRVMDTVGFTKVPKIKMDVERDEATGRITFRSQMNPLPLVDDWAVLSDGSIALVRGRDYHIDWVRPDGSRESSPKIPFEWQRLTDEDKVAFIDSVKAMRERMAASAPQAAGGGLGAILGGAADAGGGAPGGAGMTIIIGGGPGGGGGAGPRGAGGAGSGSGPGGPGRAGGPGGATAQMNFVPPTELPDYKPPFFAGAARADQDGNLWIRTIPTKAIAGGPVYDVINAKGELLDRVQVPKDRTIVGFGAGGAVYLAVRDGAVTKLEKARGK